MKRLIGICLVLALGGLLVFGTIACGGGGGGGGANNTWDNGVWDTAAWG